MIESSVKIETLIVFLKTAQAKGLCMNELSKVFVTRQLIEGPLDQLDQTCLVDIWSSQTPPTYEQLCQQVVGCHGLITMITDKVDAHLMDIAGPQLKVICNYGVGFNNIDIPAATQRGIRVGNTPNALTEATADIAAGLILSCARRLQESSASIPRGEWKTWEPLGFLGYDLVGKRLGIVGMGRIGQAVAKRFALGWDMEVVYTSRSPKPEVDQHLKARRVEIDELIETSDVVSVHTNLTDATRGLFNQQTFNAMKPTSIFINTARGSIHNQHDLYEALKGGAIAAAGLDVTDPEPILLSDPLLTLPNCIILPHIGSATYATRTRMAQLTVNNLIAGLNDEPLPCQVNT